MKILLASPTSLMTPPAMYGGMERAAAWLADAMLVDGVDVGVLCREGSEVGGAIWCADESDYANVDLGGYDAVIDFTHTKAIGRANPGFPQINVWQVMVKTHPINPVYISTAQRHSIDSTSAAPVIYYGLDHRLYPPRLSASGAEPYILYMGAILPSKRVHWAISAAKMANVQLKIAGPVFNSEYFADLDLSKAEYVGEVGGEDKLTLLSNASALIHPVGGDGWVEAGAIVALEALAVGTPVIGSDNGCLSEYIYHGSNGFICQNLESYVRAIRRIWTISRLDCVHSSKAFNSARMATDYISLARRVIAGESWL